MPAQKRSSNHRNNNNNNNNNEEQPSFQHRPSRRKQSTTTAGTGTGNGTAVDQLPTSQSQLLLMLPLPLKQEQEQDQQNDDELQEDQPAMTDQDPVEETQQDDSDGSGTDPEEFDDMITVLRSELRNNVQCPICLGIIKKTRTVMGCLHRFCRECIDKSMRLGNNECPACRIHCASRRSLRDDQDFDSFIEAIYPDAEKYEEEELMFGEEDKTRNQQIQASIEQISRRQSEALYKKRKSGKEADDSLQLQIPRPCYNSYSRRRKKTPKIEVEEFDDIDNDGHENPSSSGNHGTETKQKMRKKRRTGAQPSTGNSDGSRSSGNKAIQMSEEMCTALKAVRKSETLTWGRGGTRSSRLYRGNPLSKLIDCLEDVITAETETDVQSTKASLENGKNPSSEKSIITSHPGLSINQVLEPKPKPESPEAKVPTEGVEGVSAKSMSAPNESAVKPEASMDVPDPLKSTITSNESAVTVISEISMDVQDPLKSSITSNESADKSETAVKSETFMNVPDPSKSMKTANEPAVKAETKIDIVPYPSSPDVSQPEVGLQILDQKENVVEEATCPSENNEHLAGDINA